MTRILFICGKARMRSPTAAQIVGEIDGVETDFAGLSQDADERLSPEQLDWADLVVVMEKRQLARLKRPFKAALKGKRVVSLDIPDRYSFMQAELVARIRQQLPRLGVQRPNHARREDAQG